MIADILGEYIKRASILEEEIADLEEVLAGRKADLSHIYEEDIPSVLHENGLAAAPLADGRTVTLEQVVSVTQKDKASLLDWLRGNRYDAIVRTSLDFGKGAAVEAVEDWLHAQGYDFERDVVVHPMSLKAVIRKHLEEGGLPPPEEAAKVHVFERARIKGGDK